MAINSPKNNTTVENQATSSDKVKKNTQIQTNDIQDELKDKSIDDLKISKNNPVMKEFVRFIDFYTE